MCARKLTSVLSVVTTLTTVRRCGRNGTSNNRGSKNRDCNVFFILIKVELVQVTLLCSTLNKLKILYHILKQCSLNNRTYDYNYIYCTNFCIVRSAVEITSVSFHNVWASVATGMKYMRKTAGYTWIDHKTNTDIAKEI